MSKEAKVETFIPKEYDSSERSSDRSRSVMEDIYEGLTTEPKDLSAWPKYLYNSEGSELFEKITEQPEYYQTRTELSMLRHFSKDIVEGGGFRELVELGSGSSSKTKALLEAMMHNTIFGGIRYVPLDVSASAVEDGAEDLKREYPELDISGYVGDFDGVVGDFLSSLPEGYGDRLVIFLGGTIGNFTPERRKEFLAGVRSGLRTCDRFLVGVDLVKDISTLESAYDDAAGVTAAFNKNVLSAINEKIGSSFDPSLFEHKAVFNEEESRIEMWLISREKQEINLGDPGLFIYFREGEGVRTEISTKFTRESASSMFEGSGMRLVELYIDPDNLFGIAIGEPE